LLDLFVTSYLLQGFPTKGRMPPKRIGGGGIGITEWEPETAKGADPLS